jgi:hypothetical protein
MHKKYSFNVAWLPEEVVGKAGVQLLVWVDTLCDDLPID